MNINKIQVEKARGFPVIVTLCGSTRFSEAFQQAQLEKTLAGEIVLTVGCVTKSDAELFEGMSESELHKMKIGFDELHKRKIDISDYIFVLNVDGYIGESTRSEIDYAREIGVEVRYLEQQDQGQIQHRLFHPD